MSLQRISTEVLSVLVIEDESEIRDSIVCYLQNLNIFSFIVEAADGREALNKVNNQKFDLVVSDISMPKLEGLLFIERAQEVRNMKDCSYILISGRLTNKNFKKAIDLGIKNILTKPFSLEVFGSEVERILLREKQNKVYFRA